MNNRENPKTVKFPRLFAAIFYDALLLSAILFFATLPLMLIPDAIHTNFFVEGLKILWYLLVSYIYFAGFWLRGGQTAGMKPWKISLVDMQGNEVTTKQATIRFFASIISWATAGLGYLWVIVDRDNLSLHDHLSGTHIIRVE